MADFTVNNAARILLPAFAVEERIGAERRMATPLVQVRW